VEICHGRYGRRKCGGVALRVVCQRVLANAQKKWGSGYAQQAKCVQVLGPGWVSLPPKPVSATGVAEYR